MVKSWSHLRRLPLFCLCLLLLLQSTVPASVAQAPVYRSVKTDSMKIALTFDDGPHPHQTERILSILDEYDVRATFFMVGVNVRNYPDAAKAVAAALREQVRICRKSHKHLQRQHNREIQIEDLPTDRFLRLLHKDFLELQARAESVDREACYAHLLDIWQNSRRTKNQILSILLLRLHRLYHD